MKLFQKYYPLFLVSALMINALIGFQVYSAIETESEQSEGYAMMQQFAKVLHLVRKDYIDESKIDYDRLVTKAMEGMLSSLDPFSSYIGPKEYSTMKEETEGKFGGIGVVISLKKGFLSVVTPMEDTPGMKAGIIADDQIMKINGKNAVNLSLEEAVSFIKGKPGTVVHLTIYRPATEETIELAIERSIIKLDTIKSAFIKDHSIGYIQITQFSERTSSSLEKAMKRLEQQGIKALILDVRNNPGGLLTSAISVCSLFIPQDKLVVFTEGRNASKRKDFHATPGKKNLTIPMVVLINEGSASASEIVAGCLQDYQRATLVGEKSYGKGSVQSIVEIEKDRAIRLTTSKYYTPSKRIIHGYGIEPDVIIDISDEEKEKLFTLRSNYNIRKGEIIDMSVLNDRQIEKAIEVLQGKINPVKTEDGTMSFSPEKK